MSKSNGTFVNLVTKIFKKLSYHIHANRSEMKAKVKSRQICTRGGWWLGGSRVVQDASSLALA